MNNLYEVAEREAQFAEMMKARALRAENECAQWRAAVEDLIKGLREERTQLCECEASEGGPPCEDVATLAAVHWTCDAHRVVHEGDFFGPRDMAYAAALRRLRELLGQAK